MTRPHLSPNQRQALTHAATGATLQEIAHHMNTTRENIASLLSTAYIRLDVAHLPRNQKRPAAVRVAVVHGLITLPTEESTP